MIPNRMLSFIFSIFEFRYILCLMYTDIIYYKISTNAPFYKTVNHTRKFSYYFCTVELINIVPVIDKPCLKQKKNTLGTQL